MSTRPLLATIVVVASLASGGSVRAAVCWNPPVTAPVTDSFRPPACRWCPGNRGIEYGTVSGAPVVAVATGRVSYAGTIAAVVYVVVRHADGRRVTYGNLVAPRQQVGDVVVRGTIIGRVTGRLHLGLREGDEYVDPTPLLGRWVHRPRLIPHDRSPGNPPGPPRLTCRRA